MFQFPTSDPHKSKLMKRNDRVLHQRLINIFRERRIGTSSQSKELMRPYQQNDIVHRILKENDTIFRGLLKETAEKLSLLWILVLARYHSSAELLVSSGADVNELFGFHPRNQVIDEEWTVLKMLLHMEPSPENERLIRQVADHGADLQARDSEGRTVLHFAVTEGRVQMAEVLLEKGADLQARDFRRQSVLHFAVEAGQVEMIEMLLERGAEIDAADNQSVTPLLKAASSRKAAELLPLLIKHGADVSVKDKLGQNVLYWLSIATVEHADLVRVLIEKGASFYDREYDSIRYQPIHRAIVAGHNELVKIYLDHGANANLPAYDGRFPLFLAIRNPSTPAILETLLKHGADVNIAVYHGNTPFALMHPKNIEHSSIRLMLRILALKKVRQPSIELKDERLIEGDQKLRDYYRDCIEEIEKTKVTRFFESWTFFDILTKCHCQIAGLMRNPDFEINFKNYDLTKFSMYTEDILVEFKRAEKYHQSILEKEDVINEAVYGILPYLVVRRVAYYALWCRCKG